LSKFCRLNFLFHFCSSTNYTRFGNFFRLLKNLLKVENNFYFCPKN
jgi:hypothetical protein